MPLQRSHDPPPSTPMLLAVAVVCHTYTYGSNHKVIYILSHTSLLEETKVSTITISWWQRNEEMAFHPREF